MFFTIFTAEEKQNMLALLYNIARCDNEYHDKESQLIAGYALQMGVDNVEVVEQRIEVIINKFSNSSDMVKKAIFMESYGLIMADNFMHQAELEILNYIQSAFGFSSEYKEEVRLWLEKMLPVYFKGFELIGIKT